jgi:outer membrane autotransporter protein
VEPQAQVVVSRRTGTKEAAISGATTVRQDGATTAAARVGVRLVGEVDAKYGKVEPYARVNLWKGANGTSRTTFTAPAGATEVAANRGFATGEVAVGATWKVKRNVHLYGEAGQSWALRGAEHGQAAPKALHASFGVRVSF